MRSDGPGRGSEFTVVLPLASESIGVDAVSEPGRTVKTVVLMEDQDDARRMMQLLLDAQGVTVTTARDGLEGAELIERLKPDLALVDLGLPVMNGFDLARRIRQNAAYDGTRLIALSGYGQDSDIRAAVDAGFEQHLTKPPDPKRLECILTGIDRDFTTEPHPPDGGSRALLR